MGSGLRKTGLLLLAVVSLVVACGSPPKAAGSADDTHDEAVNTVVGDALPNADLAELGQASDLVIFGHVVKVVGGVQIGSDADAGHTVVTIAVDEILKGNAETKTVEVAMLTHIHGVPVEIVGRPTPKVDDRGIWMLRPIAAEFHRTGYVLTNQNSQILAGEDGLTGGDPSSPSAQEIKKLGNLDSVREHLRATAN
jgi:hypothetical protein